ncbi:DNA-binding transcriptional regulator, AcrR family [Saccharopolyspora antimicrobica]|uniref:DNA-binding transcriptional regulator, AcrR family n=1 Tax=Saccharopolyspora antimicrobica TaxID=455193 RepID=A0A1I5FQC8_9PSEU|nr:TetR/AcrR family transcriptional regulator [Saccharopolyspora antimicrobica]RKT82262.1 TetR family transcriptional regulator [Saccharopolyspora antimicrobica]SFO25799.1 DNA-binding transcriptional regulator, AcrR family [Saccharopolyspora antimicrobica]
MAAGTSRRERLRQAALEEIHAAARALLVEGGPAAVTINAVARRVGMSGPALYHYYASHDELVGAVTADFFRELATTMEQARDALGGAPVGDRLLAACRAMRGWATTHPAEFGWIFASPITPADQRPDSPRHRAGQRFEQILLDLTAELWRTRPFPVPEPAELAPSLRGQLADYSESIGGILPPEAAHVFLSCWVRLYGLLCMEVLHQLDFAYTDLEPVFEECLREISGRLGIG